ncbi:hypothetical protein [Streptomyces broussonetiae]|uniref:Uncharacterized protein n=1 Tax=Streptomyces broussonetiae TaxID=2686304 RepID=A0A6I6MXB3_9ACTN|nr:hypothetical protein [Streptomyces broussonetiae]QHA02250.1 hypothetical protein GQF42_01945 [Streptomyces broussonetiae]
MSTPVPRSRRLRVPAPGAATPRQPVDWAKVGRRSVRWRATGMTATEAAAALEEAVMNFQNRTSPGGQSIAGRMQPHVFLSIVEMKNGRCKTFFTPLTQVNVPGNGGM